MSDWYQALSYAVMPWMAVIYQLPWIVIVVQLGVAWLGVMLIHRIGTAFLMRMTASLPFSRRLVRYGNRAGQWVVFFLVAQVVLPVSQDPNSAVGLLRHVNALLLIAALTWFGVRCVAAIADTIIERNPADVADNLYARRVQTQTRVLARCVMVLLVVVGSGMALMTLPMLRQIGTSLLASAGVAGLVIGFAAKPVLSNLLAGLQIALTQPIRLEDVVIINNEWGQIEEITGTYVVVRIWDQRRMIVPLQWFIENPFQNWTRTNADILGTVLIWVDYRMPLEPLRQEAERLCRDAPEWDQRLCQSQVVESSERAMQIRVLVSASDAGRCWDLRCRVREGLVDYIQREFPEYLPQLRTDLRDKPMSKTAGAAPATTRFWTSE
jgi:small-conductance mechanosensitive channel